MESELLGLGPEYGPHSGGMLTQTPSWETMTHRVHTLWRSNAKVLHHSFIILPKSFRVASSARNAAGPQNRHQPASTMKFSKSYFPKPDSPMHTLGISVACFRLHLPPSREALFSPSTGSCSSFQMGLQCYRLRAPVFKASRGTQYIL